MKDTSSPFGESLPFDEQSAALLTAATNLSTPVGLGLDIHDPCLDRPAAPEDIFGETHGATLMHSLQVFAERFIRSSLETVMEPSTKPERALSIINWISAPPTRQPTSLCFSWCAIVLGCDPGELQAETIFELTRSGVYDRLDAALKQGRTATRSKKRQLPADLLLVDDDDITKAIQWHIRDAKRHGKELSRKEVAKVVKKANDLREARIQGQANLFGDGHRPRKEEPDRKALSRLKTADLKRLVS